MLNLSEIFLSIQGESTYAGLPCIFIRFAGCNLRCSYCDSEFSYEGEIEQSPESILKKIGEFQPVKLVEITGGEPLLQEEVNELFRLLIENNYTVLLETNGSMNLRNIPDEIVKIVDIKCPGSGQEDSFLEENIQFLNKGIDEIKFVISNEGDYNWSKAKINEYNILDHTVIFSPVFSILDPENLAKWIIRDKLNVRLQIQIHKYIWDPNKRGV